MPTSLIETVRKTHEQSRQEVDKPALRSWHPPCGPCKCPPGLKRLWSVPSLLWAGSWRSGDEGASRSALSPAYTTPTAVVWRETDKHVSWICLNCMCFTLCADVTWIMHTLTSSFWCAVGLPPGGREHSELHSRTDLWSRHPILSLPCIQEARKGKSYFCSKMSGTQI